MKNLYDFYFQSHFQRLNNLSEQGYDRSARYYRSYYENLLPRDKQSAILDAGCGLGQFIHFLQKEGYTNYYGIDLASDHVAICKRRGYPVEIADIFEFLQNKKQTFDLVAANDVLEHIPKTRTMEFLAVIFHALKDNGTILLKVPNMSNPFGLMDRYQDFTHEVGFTEFSLSEVLAMAGFKDIQIKGAAYPVISLQSAIGKIAEQSLYAMLRFLFHMQGHAVPRIMDKDLIGKAIKKQL
ncbi:MAG: class I SAM-dependent methyltransferase [Candidatus Wildermuthbacteria bacterium]|nr:class I SAM-dependent methyltransferase [Candidatus Wildermuthbacteria bacterium]